MLDREDIRMIGDLLDQKLEEQSGRFDRKLEEQSACFDVSVGRGKAVGSFMVYSSSGKEEKFAHLYC